MKLSSSLLLLAAFASSSSPVLAHEGVLQIHGSGTTNPSKCYWNIMEELTEQAGTAVRMSYRAVGSTTGIAEFREPIVNASASLHVMFGSGDIPIPQDTFEEINTEEQFVHLPVLAGAVSFFHSVPDTPDLNLTACVLGQIFNQKLTTWGAPEIVAHNPNLGPEARNTNIRVARRVRGSSSTESVTTYLNKACDDPELQFPSELVSDEPAWPENPDLMVGCYGSGGMTECIEDVPGTIGYIDAGHGISNGLAEVRLRNRDAAVGSTEVFRNSVESSIEEAITTRDFPPSLTGDFSAVSFLDQPGATTWPIVQMTYLYVRTDLSFIEDPQEQALLIGFLRALYLPQYIERCAELYGFTLILNNTEVKEFAEAAIDLVEESVDYNSNATKFDFETSDTRPIEGAGEYVFSVKRREIADIERAGLMEQLAALNEEIARTSTELKQLSSEERGFFGEDEETQLKAALALGSISFAFWTLWIAAYICRYLKGGTVSETAVEVSKPGGDAVIRDETDSQNIDEGASASDGGRVG